ncbi:alpha/beta hydrolase [Kitasatospora sp. MAP5-34]|uniref:alpha/beta fold hydrolase n=1 Tax=Kitasatospora sp. MAP5-34 TaxID=3035102 RepID=UPI00247729E4|nr:alpha/beta hydrolase [Kitasatospora sp. MAP5-34]MDH6578532.1 pimeloyl-ACP methyl ester carboxylesterase [Kitasatospora sp. MAP5-34]
MTETAISADQPQPQPASETSGTFGTFETGDGALAYRDTGSGEPIVLLHCGFVDHTMFDNLIPELARRYRVIAPDARGHGFSANASRPFRQTDDLAALLRHLDLGPVVLVGISMGALIAIDTAVEHPGLARALVVSGRGLGEPDLGDPWSKARVAAQNGALAAGDIPGWLDGFAQWAAGPERTLADLDPEIVRHIQEMALRTLRKHTPDEPDHRVPVADVATRAKEITVPVLAVNGALDVPGLLATADDLIAAVPGGRTVLMDGVGHYPTMERPETFTRILEDFLREVHAGKA